MWELQWCFEVCEPLGFSVFLHKYSVKHYLFSIETVQFQAYFPDILLTPTMSSKDFSLECVLRAYKKETKELRELIFKIPVCVKLHESKELRISN